MSDTVRFGAEAFDENGHTVEGAEFTWSSDDESVATVDESGLVRGARPGAATITATSEAVDGSARIVVFHALQLQGVGRRPPGLPRLRDDLSQPPP